MLFLSCDTMFSPTEGHNHCFVRVFLNSGEAYAQVFVKESLLLFTVWLFVAKQTLYSNGKNTEIFGVSRVKHGGTDVQQFAN